MKDLIIDISENNLFRHTCCLEVKKGECNYIAKGTGILIKSEENYFVFTASHVIDCIDELDGFFIGTKNGYVNIGRNFIKSNLAINSQIDVGCIKLDLEVVKVLNKTFIFFPDKNIINHHEQLNEYNYIAFGYPESSRLVKEKFVNSTVKCIRLAPSKTKAYNYHEFDSTDFILLDFKGKMKNQDGKFIPVPQPNGMSGGGLWVVGSKFEEDIEYYYYFLVGIITECRKSKYHVLIVNKMNNLINLMAEMN